MLEHTASQTASISTTPVKNDARYDMVKFFLSLLVMAIHASVYPRVLFPWLRIAVPLFFIMSSYFVFSKLHNASADKQKRILTKFVLRNLLLYLCWFIILFPMILLRQKDVYFSGGFFHNLLAIAKNILFGSPFVASWFIMATVLGVLIVFFVSKLLRKNFFVFLFAFAVFCIVTLESSYSSVIANTFLGTAIDGYIAIFDRLVCSFPAAIFWVFMGKLFAEQKVRCKSMALYVLLLLCSCIALFLEWKFVMALDGSYKNDSYFMLAPVCVLLFLGIQKCKPIHWSHSVYFKRASTIIYVTHGSILPIASKVISVVLHVKHPLLSCAATLICCMTIYLLLETVIAKCANQRITKTLKLLY